MFRVISIVLALALAGVGEVSLMFQDNPAENWAQQSALMESVENLPQTVEMQQTEDFNAHFMHSTASGAADGENREETVDDNDADAEEEDPRVSNELINIMINGQVDQSPHMQMRN